MTGAIAGVTVGHGIGHADGTSAWWSTK